MERDLGQNEMSVKLGETSETSKPLCTWRCKLELSEEGNGEAAFCVALPQKKNSASHAPGGWKKQGGDVTLSNGELGKPSNRSASVSHDGHVQ